MKRNTCQVKLIASDGQELGTKVMHWLSVGDKVSSCEKYWEVVSVKPSGRGQVAWLTNASKATKLQPKTAARKRDTLPDMRKRHDRAEMELLVEALEDTDWMLTRAAKLLDVESFQVRRMVEKYRLKKA